MSEESDKFRNFKKKPLRFSFSYDNPHCNKHENHDCGCVMCQAAFLRSRMNQEDKRRLEWEKTNPINLRDQFAMQAMNAIIIGNGADTCALGIGAAKDAYAVADAMLAVRLAHDTDKA